LGGLGNFKGLNLFSQDYQGIGLFFKDGKPPIKLTPGEGPGKPYEIIDSDKLLLFGKNFLGP